MDRIRELEVQERRKRLDGDEAAELAKLRREAAKKRKEQNKEVNMLDAQPSLSHMAIATLIHRGMAHSVVTTNLDGIHRKSGLRAHDQIANLHGCVYAERCTNPDCGYDFERNFETRRVGIHVHDHHVGTCPKCGSRPPKSYTGEARRGAPTGSDDGASFATNGLVGTQDEKLGTKDTHINFGEFLDDIDWKDAERMCRGADLCIVAGTSMSLRHITHFPFMAKQTVILNLQPTPDDAKADVRIWGKCDPVFSGLMKRLAVEIEPTPAWHPRDAMPLDQLPADLNPYYVRAAQRLAKMAARRERETAEREAAKKRQRQAGAAAAKKRPRRAAAATAAAPTASTSQRSRVDRVTNAIKSMFTSTAAEATAEPTSAAAAPATAAEAAPAAAALATAAAVSHVRVGNTHRPANVSVDAEQNCHEWKMRVSATDQHGHDVPGAIRAVTFKLHPTFTPDRVCIRANEPSQAVFELPPRLGWGTFPVEVQIDWQQQGLGPTHVSHGLRFDRPSTFRSIAVSG